MDSYFQKVTFDTASNLERRKMPLKMKIRIYVLFIILLTSSCRTLNPTPSNMKEKLVITGHRGAASIEAENTISGIAKALQIEGIHRIEIDVQQTKDGIVVLMHDPTLDRTTTGRGKVSDYTYEELQAFDVILRDGTKEKIPSLKDAFKLFDGDVEFLIEVKEKYPDIEKKIVELIEKYDAKEWCIVQSFKDNIIKEVHAISPEIRLHKLLFLGTFYNFDRFDFVEEYSLFHKLLSKRIISKIHARGKKVNVWTVNQEADIRKQIKRGVDGIISDVPELVIKIAAAEKLK